MFYWVSVCLSIIPFSFFLCLPNIEFYTFLCSKLSRSVFISHPKYSSFLLPHVPSSVICLVIMNTQSVRRKSRRFLSRMLLSSQLSRWVSFCLFKYSVEFLLLSPTLLLSSQMSSWVSTCLLKYPVQSPFVFPNVALSLHLSVKMSRSVSICLSMCQSMCLSVALFDAVVTSCFGC